MPRRWTEFDQDAADEICARLMDGQSLRAICRDEELPCAATIFNWLNKNVKFVEQYTRARDVQADVLFDEIHDIADTPRIGFKTVRKADSVETTEADMIEHRRLQIDSRKWLVGKLAPKKYSDKQVHEHGGPDGGPITLEALIMARIKKPTPPEVS